MRSGKQYKDANLAVGVARLSRCQGRKIKQHGRRADKAVADAPPFWLGGIASASKHNVNVFLRDTVLFPNNVRASFEKRKKNAQDKSARSCTAGTRQCLRWECRSTRECLDRRSRRIPGKTCAVRARSRRETALLAALLHHQGPRQDRRDTQKHHRATNPNRVSAMRSAKPPTPNIGHTPTCEESSHNAAVFLQN